MKRLILLAVLGTKILAQQPAARAVYILPMTGGLDQYLANQITHDHVMQVVADPSMADAVFTDRLGSTFEQTLAKIRPHDKDPHDSENPHHLFQKSGVGGTIFLVDTKSRRVIWSDYERPPRSVSVASLNREASRIAKKLQATFEKPLPPGK